MNLMLRKYVNYLNFKDHTFAQGILLDSSESKVKKEEHQEPSENIS